MTKSSCRACTPWLLVLSLLLALPAARAQDADPPATGSKSADATPEAVQPGNAADAPAEKTAAGKPQRIYVLKIDDAITEAMLMYLRRGIKQAVDNDADAIILEMNTPGGIVAVTEEIMDLLAKFEPQQNTFTYIDDEAVSAGSFIACATRHIYMAPSAVIGAAAPVMMGGQDIQETMQLKVTSYLRAKIRSTARANGHRPEVFEAMIIPEKELKIGDLVIKEKDELLSLTATEAAQLVGDPPAPLLSEGTVDSLDDLVAKVGAPNAQVFTVEPTGYERAAYWITTIAPVLMGLVGLLIFLEFQTQGFGIFGILAIVIVVMFFFGHYVAGLSGYEAWVLFGIGVILIGLEIFVLPGTLFFGVTGLTLMLGGLLWAMVDYFPNEPITFDSLDLITPLTNLIIAILISVAGIGTAMAVMPKVMRNSELDRATVKGSGHDAARPAKLPAVGETGETLTLLRPAGTAQFGQRRVDVVSDGRLIPKGTTVRVTRVDAMKVTVAPAASEEAPPTS